MVGGGVGGWWGVGGGVGGGVAKQDRRKVGKSPHLVWYRRFEKSPKETGGESATKKTHAPYPMIPTPHPTIATPARTPGPLRGPTPLSDPARRAVSSVGGGGETATGVGGGWVGGGAVWGGPNEFGRVYRGRFRPEEKLSRHHDFRREKLFGDWRGPRCARGGVGCGAKEILRLTGANSPY